MTHIYVCLRVQTPHDTHNYVHVLQYAGPGVAENNHALMIESRQV